MPPRRLKVLQPDRDAWGELLGSIEALQFAITALVSIRPEDVESERKEWMYLLHKMGRTTALQRKLVEALRDSVEQPPSEKSEKPT